MCAKSAKPLKLKQPPSAEHIAARRRFALKLAVLVLVTGGTFTTLYVAKHKVEQKYAHPSAPPNVVLKNRPAWMTDYLASRITAVARPRGIHSAFDHQLLVDIRDQLTSDPDIAPWIKEVRQVRRTYVSEPGDTIEVDCDFRAPIALVRWNDAFWFVDNDGVKLPEQFTPTEVPKIAIGPAGKIVMRIIEGVRHVPVDPGMRWTGDDLAAGLEMVKLLANQPFAEDVVKVDVSNFQGRDNPRDAFISLVTRYNTAIKWGRPPSAKDYFIEVSTARKLDELAQIYNQYGRIDAKHPWLDIRFDKITYPADQPATADAESTTPNAPNYR